MRIKELAAAVGLPPDTIRHYEKAGLLTAPARGDNNYRRYSASDAQRLRFIRNCRALDMSLGEVRVLLAYLDAPQPDCSPVTQVVAEHLAHVRDRLKVLRELERQLKSLQHACNHAHPDELCGVVLALGADDGVAGAQGAVHGR